MRKRADALGFKFYVHPSRADGIWACCLLFPTSAGQVFYGSRYSSDRCVTPDVGKYYLGLVPHGSFAQHGDLGSGFLLQTFDGVALRSQNLPHEIELAETQKIGGEKYNKCQSKDWRKQLWLSGIRA